MPLRPGMPIGAAIRELYHHGSHPRSREQIIAIAEANHRRHAQGGGIARRAFGGPMPGPFMRQPAMPAQPNPQMPQMPMPNAGNRFSGQMQPMMRAPVARPGLPGTMAQNGGPVRLARGGIASPPAASGFLAGATSGRGDHVLSSAPSGSYVLPADVVAALGQGNSIAGARVWDEMLKGLPDTGGGGLPQSQPGGKGIAGQQVPVALSHGEILVSDHDVQRIGHGSHKAGWAVLDHFVKQVRAHHIEELKKLKPPVGSKA